jgi:hypothetical protein
MLPGCAVRGGDDPVAKELFDPDCRISNECTGISTEAVLKSE